MYQAVCRANRTNSGVIQAVPFACGTGRPETEQQTGGRRCRPRALEAAVALKPFRFDQVFRDVRVAFRQIRRAPGFAAVVVVTLALGVGANSAVFALADAALLRPLPFADPDRLVMAWERRGATTTMPSPAEFRAWSARLRSFE